MKYVIGLDVGTTSVKAVAFDNAGQALARSSFRVPTVSGGGGRQEQQCKDLLEAVDGVLDGVVSQLDTPPEAIGLSTHMHSLLLVGQNDQLLSECILWSDLRAGSIAQQLRSEGKAHDFYRHSGTPVHAMSPLCKIAWFRREAPELFRQTRLFAGVKALLIHHLAGQWCSDYSTASATGLFDAEALDWYRPALDFCGINKESLPVPLSPLKVLQARPGGPLPEATKIIAGASDGCLANLGAGALDATTAVLTVGTSGAYRVSGPERLHSACGGIFSYLLSGGLPQGFPSEKLYVSGGASNNGAVAYQWFCEHWLDGIPEPAQQQALLDATATEVGGLLFLPHIYGERAPLWKPSATGVFAGIRPHHGKAHFHRAVMEGILLNMAMVAEQVGATVREIRAGGGYVRSEAWVQMTADVFGLPVQCEAGGDDSARGAAMLAVAALEHRFPEQFVPDARQVFTPRPPLHAIYREKLQAFKELCARMY